MFENKLIRGIHASRYIMSWVREGGELHWQAGVSDFSDWLKTLGLDEDEVEHIVEIARSGKMELEMMASGFIKRLRQAEKI